VARLVRGRVEAPAPASGRFRDGFLDLMPGEEARLRFEVEERGASAAAGNGARAALEVSAQNAPAVRIELA
jgi:hypothetical protein